MWLKEYKEKRERLNELTFTKKQQKEAKWLISVIEKYIENEKSVIKSLHEKEVVKSLGGTKLLRVYNRYSGLSNLKINDSIIINSSISKLYSLVYISNLLKIVIYGKVKLVSLSFSEWTITLSRSETEYYSNSDYECLIKVKKVLSLIVDTYSSTLREQIVASSINLKESESVSIEAHDFAKEAFMEILSLPISDAIEMYWEKDIVLSGEHLTTEAVLANAKEAYSKNSPLLIAKRNEEFITKLLESDSMEEINELISKKKRDED